MWTFGEYLIRRISADENIEANHIIGAVMKEYDLPPHDGAGVSAEYDIFGEYVDDFFGVVAYKGSIVGTIALKKLTLSQGMLKKNYLLKDHRGKGVGTFMLQKVLALGKEWGLSEIMLETSGILKEAIHLYKKNGFVSVDNKASSDHCEIKYSLVLN